jgi:hypothetical protein
MTPYTIDVPLPKHIDGEETLIPETKTTSFVTFLSEYIRLTSILGEISSRVYRSTKDRDGTQPSTFITDRTLQAGLDVIVDLESKLSRYESSVPPALSWKTPNRFDKTAMEPRRKAILEEQSNVLHGRLVNYSFSLKHHRQSSLTRPCRFLYLRLMLHRPVLSQYYHTSAAMREREDGEALSPEAALTSFHDIYGSFAEDSARACFKSAMDLLDLVYNTYLTNQSGGWWWDGFCE